MSEPTSVDNASPDLDVLLLVASADDAEGAVELLRSELPEADITVSATAEEALAELQDRPFDAFVEQLPAVQTRGLVGSARLAPEHLQQPVLALTDPGDGGTALWSLRHYPPEPAPVGESRSGLGAALRKTLQDGRSLGMSFPSAPLLGIVEALEASICAVDETGLIVFRNAAWRAFGAANGADPHTSGPVNYLDVCDGVDLDAARGLNSLDNSDAGTVAEGLRAVICGALARFEHSYPCHSPQEERWFTVRITPWTPPNGAGGAVITHLDITEMHQAQVALNHQVLHDDLTGLPNRTLLRDRLRQALHDARRRDTLVGVGFVDLDFFKRVNNAHGHPVGDALLRNVGWRLSEQLRAGDTLARFGGDEFVVVWRDLDSAEQAHELAQRLSDCLSAPFELGDVRVNVSASIGLVTSAAPNTAEELIEFADAAMYEAKRHGRSRVRLFERDLRENERERQTLELELREAVPGGQLVLHYQPVIELVRGTVVGLEALVRWDHPTRGLLGPQHFIPLAEATGFIVTLGRWTLDQACTDAAAMTGEAAKLHVAVNLSARQLSDHDVVDHVRDALSASKLEPHRLVLEVTESAIMQDEDVAALVLEEIHDLGVVLAIDDFGTGFSSLLYLRRYPIGAIKIDRAFVAALPDSSDDHAICTSVVSLAKAVRAISIAEGVETAEQCAALRAMGCQLAQGFLWSRPVPLAELAAALAACQQVGQVSVRAITRPRPPDADPAVRLRILGLQDAGASLHTIAAALNAEGTQTGRGTRWTATAVARYGFA